MDSEQQRFWDKILVKGIDECWPWFAASTNNGDWPYGVMTIKRDDGKGNEFGWRNMYAHRLCWEYTYGPIPEGFDVLHSCDFTLCCNPSHLFLGTQKDNTADMLQKGRGRWNSQHHV